jgi:enterochelin esterase-like enzyme
MRLPRPRLHTPASFIIAAAVLGLSRFAIAQTATPPAPTRPAPAPAVVSPEIADDRRVTFRLRAPKANAVTVSGQFLKSPAAMTKDADGVWSVTVGPVAPELYEYSFNVDGLATIDPGNRDIKPMRNPRSSILEVPGSPPLLHDFQDVPHGSVTLHWYNSKSLGRRRALQVYTPPGYARERSARFPTLYLLHGSGDNEGTWVANGHAHWILDNLIAQGRAKPMIVVMLDGHAVAPTSAAARGTNTAVFERDLLEDAMPFVTANYRVGDGAANRAIVGLSMGGGQSLTVGLKHADQFAWVGGMSSAVPEVDTLLADTAALNSRLKLLWFACGRDDQLMSRNTALDAALTSRGVRHEFLATDGNHSWPVWRKHLAIFAPRIFQGK